MARIVHAIGDENGNARGGLAGDQTGREIRIQDWYNRDGGWGVCLVPTDTRIAALAVAFAIQIANDDSFGYDQDERWTGLTAIQDAGDIASAEDSEMDCSSLIDVIYLLAGLDVDRGYTGNLERRYLATGLFVAHREAEYLNSPDYAPKGSIYLTAGKHVAILIDDGSESPMTTEEIFESGEGGSDTEAPYVKIIDSVNVRNLPGKVMNDDGGLEPRGKVIYTARDENLQYFGKDFRTGWFRVKCAKGVGFVSNKIPRYAKLVEE